MFLKLFQFVPLILTKPFQASARVIIRVNLAEECDFCHDKGPAWPGGEGSQIITLIAPSFQRSSNVSSSGARCSSPHLPIIPGQTPAVGNFAKSNLPHWLVAHLYYSPSPTPGNAHCLSHSSLSEGETDVNFPIKILSLERSFEKISA